MGCRCSAAAEGRIWGAAGGSEEMDQKRLRTFLLGGAIGALAGILLAPRSGREFRGSIMERAGEARERSRETYFQAQDRMQERLAGVREGSRGTPDPENEAFVGPARAPASPGPAPGAARPPLRDVSWDARRESTIERDDGETGRLSDTAEDDLRRLVRETQARLRARLDEPGRPDPAHDEDSREDR